MPTSPITNLLSNDMPHKLPTIVAEVLNGSGVEATEHSLISFFLENVNSSGQLKWGTYKRYRKKFIPNKIHYFQLKGVVDSNFLHVKDKVLSLKSSDSSNNTFTENEDVKVDLLNFLKSRVSERSRRLKYRSFAAASREFKISSEEIKTMWKAHIELEKKRNSNSSNQEKTDSEDPLGTMSFVNDESSISDSILTQADSILTQAQGEVSS